MREHCRYLTFFKEDIEVMYGRGVHYPAVLFCLRLEKMRECANGIDWGLPRRLVELEE
jgi:hypothetical protein